MIDHQSWSLQRRTLLAGFAALAASTVFGGNPLMAAIEQNTLKRRGVGLRACEPERAFPGFTLFAPHFVQNTNVYLIDLQGEVVHTWNMPYPPGLSGYLTERGTLFYNGRTSEESFLSRFPFKGGVVLEADWNGKVLWEVRHPDHHHHGILLRNGNVLIFDNGPHRLDDAVPYSRVVEVNPATIEIVWKYQDKPTWNFFSPRMGFAQRLPNGNTLITESSFGRVFEVTKEDEIVWEYINPFFGQALLRRPANLGEQPGVPGDSLQRRGDRSGSGLV